MVNILEYIVSNYVWFLGSAILILLAIIGYYADKTNFGDKIQEKKELDTSKLQNIGLSNIINGDMENSNTSNENNINAQDELINTQVQNIEGEKLEPKAEESSQLNSDLSQASYYTHGEEKLTTSSNFENSLDISESLPNDVLVSKENPNNNIEVENSESKILNQDYETEENSSSEMNSINLNETTMSLDEEIESFLPEKEVIDTDLLEDIDNLKLDKTQKIDINSLMDLDDIQLPKIDHLTSTDEDIWKF